MIADHNTTSSSSVDFHGVHLSHVDMIVIAVAAIVVGTLLTFLGKRLFKPSLFIAGFVSLGGLAYYCMHEISTYHDVNFSKLEGVLIPCAFGLVGGCIVLGIEKLGFFLAGASVGTAISFMVFSAVGLDRFGSHGEIVRLVVVIVVSLICGALVVYQEMKLIILITSIGGAFMAVAGADFFVKSGYVDSINSIFVHDKIDLPNGDYKLYIMLGSTIVMAILGIFVQTRTNKRSGPGWDEDEYLLGRRVNY